MVVNTAGICPFGWKARDFALKGVDGKTYSLADIRGPKGTLVVFICNHCPYVKASISRIVGEANALRQIGIGTIAIISEGSHIVEGVLGIGLSVVRHDGDRPRCRSGVAR